MPYKYLLAAFLTSFLLACDVDNKQPTTATNKDTQLAAEKYEPIATESIAAENIATESIATQNTPEAISKNSNNIAVEEYPIATENAIAVVDTKAINLPVVEPKKVFSTGAESYKGSLNITVPNVNNPAEIQHFVILNAKFTSIIGKNKAANEYFSKGKANINVIAHNENYNIPLSHKFVVGKEYIVKVSADTDINTNAQQVKFKYTEKYAQINIVLSNEIRSPKDSLNVEATDKDGGLLNVQFVIENANNGKNYGALQSVAVYNMAQKPMLTNLAFGHMPNELLIDAKQYNRKNPNNKFVANQAYYVKFVCENFSFNKKFIYKGQSTICITIDTRTSLDKIAETINKFKAEQVD